MAAPSVGSQRTSAVRRLFSIIESRFGGVSSLIDTGCRSEVILRDDGVIRECDLTRLTSHEATAVHVRNFFDRDAAAALGSRLADEALRSGGGNNWKVSTSRGLESSDVATLGAHVPYNVASSSGREEDVNNYFEGVRREFRDRRRSSPSANSSGYPRRSDVIGSDDTAAPSSAPTRPPQLWPMDKLRLELDEAWPSGAGLAREVGGHRRPFGGGLPRVMNGPTRWRRGFIHVDELGPLSPRAGLFSANVYLQLPRSSDGPGSTDGDDGDLYIWPLGVRSRLEWYKVRHSSPRK